MNDDSYEILVEHRGSSRAEVAVCLRVTNQETVVAGALDSVTEQDLPVLNLVVIDDHSSDNSARVCAHWLDAHRSRFNTVTLLRHTRPLGLAASRNRAFSECDADHAFVLDAGDRLFPRCLSRCLEALSASGAALAYPTLEVFGERTGLVGTAVEAHRNIHPADGMALVKASAWNVVGGYAKTDEAGMEDSDFWSRLARKNLFGVHVPEILARHRARRTPGCTIGDAGAEHTILKFGYIGQILPHKGLAVLLDAAEIAGASARGRLEVHIWGNTHEEQSDFNRQLFAKVEQLPGLVYFHGQYVNDQLERILSEIDALVVPSTWWENSPLTIQEAFLANVPVLTSNIGGMKELVRDGIHGLLFEVNNHEDLAAKMLSIVERPSQLETFRANRPDEVVQQMDDHVRKMAAIYRTLLDAGASE